MNCETKGTSAAASLKGAKHKFNEDRYRLLPKAVPLVGSCNRGEIFAIFDGIGSAPKGRDAAQEMADRLIKFYKEPANFSPTWEGLRQLLFETNMLIHNWGFKAGTEIPLGGCAGTITWLTGNNLFTFHAGDTTALLIRDEQAQQLTHVHELENGALYRYFGLGPYLDINVGQVEVQDSDKILLLTDGVTKVFHPIEAADIVKKHDDNCRAVTELARLAMTRGSIDDITVVLVELEMN